MMRSPNVTEGLIADMSYHSGNRGTLMDWIHGQCSDQEGSRLMEWSTMCLPPVALEGRSSYCAVIGTVRMRTVALPRHSADSGETKKNKRSWALRNQGRPMRRRRGSLPSRWNEAGERAAGGWTMVGLERRVKLQRRRRCFPTTVSSAASPAEKLKTTNRSIAAGAAAHTPLCLLPEKGVGAGC